MCKGRGEAEDTEGYILTGLLSGFVYGHSRLVSIVEAVGRGIGQSPVVINRNQPVLYRW